MEGEKREIIDENKRMNSEIFNMSNEFKEMKESFNTLERYSRRDLDYHNDNKIYIVESLTQKNRELLKECIEAKNDLNFKFTWTTSGRILMRKGVNSPVIQIRSHADLQKLCLEPIILDKYIYRYYILYKSF
jgi:hypothetical protein